MFTYLKQVLSHFEWAWNHTNTRRRASIAFNAFAYCVALWAVCAIVGFSFASLYLALALGFSIGTLMLGFVARVVYLNAAREIWAERATQATALLELAKRLEKIRVTVTRHPHLEASFDPIVYSFDRMNTEFKGLHDNYPCFLVNNETLVGIVTNLEILEAKLENASTGPQTPNNPGLTPAASRPLLATPARSPAKAAPAKSGAKLLYFPDRHPTRPVTSAR